MRNGANMSTIVRVLSRDRIAICDQCLKNAF